MKKMTGMLAAILAIFVFWFTSNAAADSVVISGIIVDVQGRPISGATISVADAEHSIDESGIYSITVSPADIYRLSISAHGYFSFIQTFSRADLSDQSLGAATIGVPPITLVRRKPGRRLFVFAGDTMMGRRFVEPPDGEPALIRAATVAEDMRSILQNAKPYLELADFASVNLETQLLDSRPPDALPKSVTFYTSTTIAGALKWAGIDYVALGNNHTFDYLEIGLSRTIDALDDVGLSYSGAGHTASEARKPYTTTIGNQRVDLLSYVGWPGNFEPNQVADSNKGGAAYGTAKSIARDLDAIPGDSLSIIQYHSGLEYVSYPPLAEETQLKLAVDRGADLALGHHSHVFQGFEIYKGKLIAYSLGNFVFDQYLYSTHSAILLFVWYDGNDFYRAEVVPMHVNGYIPTPATGHIRFDILQRLTRLSDPTSVCWSRSGGHGAFQECSTEVPPSDAQNLHFSGNVERKSGSILRLSSHDVDPLRTIQTIRSTEPYRLGLDILRRGDFEYAGLFNTHDRTWIDDPRVSIVGRDSMVMEIDLVSGDKVTTGMKVFTRVFTRSNPATVVGKIKSTGCAELQFSLQRRPDRMSLADALKDGPMTDIGKYTASGAWSEFTIDFQLPRTATRSIRLLIDVENCEPFGTDIIVTLDDLALIEWQTPWLPASTPDPISTDIQATHMVFRP